MRLRLPGKWEINAFANTAILVVGAIGRTMRVTVENAHVMEDRLASGSGQVLVTWHGRTLVALVHYRNRGLFTIISPSRDGEIQYRLYRKFGWDATRGSTGRDAAKAALACVRKLREGATLALAPDGPRGPSGVVQPGTFYFARKAGCPIIPAGVSATPAWTMKSWDSFQFPKLFARAAIVYGEPVVVPSDADDETLARLSRELGETINGLQRRADVIIGVKS
ncbi:MAG TPA: lysophospholipid acyltransferase family protein [Armatimonadota bacterium]|jgi:hypothetical protein